MSKVKVEGQPIPTTYSNFRRVVSGLGVIEGLGLTALGTSLTLDSLVQRIPPEALPAGIITGIMGLIALEAGLLLDGLPKLKAQPQQLQLELK